MQILTCEIGHVNRLTAKVDTVREIRNRVKHREGYCIMSTAENIELTKEYITNALFSLMGEKPYEEITVTDITNKAGVGRATYYRHFKTKTDIIRCYFEKEAERFTISVPTEAMDPDSYYEVTFNVFSRLKEHKAVFKRLLDAHLESIYLDYINEAMVKNFENHGYGQFAYGPYYVTGSLFNVSIQWVKNDCKESVKYMADHYLEMVFAGRGAN